MALLAALVAGCGSSPPLPEPTLPPPPSGAAPTFGTLKLEPLLAGAGEETLDFMGLRSPTNLVQAPNGKVFITDQSGLIRSFEHTVLQPEIEHIFFSDFLDIRDRVSARGSEEGLLGMALDPRGFTRLYVYYSASNPRRSVVSRFFYSSRNKSADPESELIILEIEQPYPNHNGGQLAFGPDGYLYVGLGDGGSGATRRATGRIPRRCWGQFCV